jgi:16S rRNA (adenine1518-N6/adenine1519-N6)-dimethyltransferase
VGRLAGVQRKSWCPLTIRLLGRTDIRRLAKELEFRPRKSLGQNFVHDGNTVRRIVSISGIGRTDHVLEVGPGLGSLTLALLDRGATVTAVPALLHLLAEFPSIQVVTVMVQAEVAERLAAEPGGKEYGVPSVKARFFGRVRRCGMVSPTVFWPVPRVYSGLVRIDRYDTSPWQTDDAFRRQVFQLIDIAFAQRRKTSRNAFLEWAGSGNESANRLLAASIDPARRGETLSIEDFVRLLRRSGDPAQPQASGS